MHGNCADPRKLTFDILDLGLVCMGIASVIVIKPFTILRMGNDARVRKRDLYPELRRKSYDTDIHISACQSYRTR